MAAIPPAPLTAAATAAYTTPPLDGSAPPGATRTERDSFGDIAVPRDALWGAQTQRSLAFFAIGCERMPRELIEALVHVKRAAAVVNGALDLLPHSQAQAIVAAADEVLAGQHADMFPLSVWQTGSGTQTNMNVNEVLANLASIKLGGQLGSGRIVHPNDMVNMGQSSNDVFPTAMHVALAVSTHRELLPALSGLAVALEAHVAAFDDIVKIGRTHLQDATPLTLGQEFSGYVAQLTQVRDMLGAAARPLQALAIGGTAVGTGLNTHPEFGTRVAAELTRMLGQPFTSAGNKFAALAGHEPIAFFHGALKTLACALHKIANDLRWLASGPRAGLGEIAIPENEPGSSIMPGKVNPTQCEAVTMVAAQVMGNDTTIGFAAANGNFELNVYKPVIAHAALQSVKLLTDAMESLRRHCVAGIQPRRERIEELVQRSLMLVTALAPRIGYDQAAQVAKLAHAQGLTLKEAALQLGAVDEATFDALVDPRRMIAPGTGAG
jgi:fumarate hydratase class II